MPDDGKSGQRWRTSLIVMLVVAACWTACFHFPASWRATGIGDSTVPFLDLYGVLAAGEVAHANGNPYQPIHLDPFNRPHLYSGWWLVSGALGLTRADTEWLGQLLLELTLVASVVLVRPRRAVEAWQMIVVLCSPAMLMALNRGNSDLVILVIICAALGCLRAESTPLRALGVVLLAVAAVLKYFPLVTLVVLLSARSRREWILATGLFGLVLVAGWPAIKPGLESAARYKPHPDGLFAFGAPTLFRDFHIYSPVAWLAFAAVVGAWAVWLALRRWKVERDDSPDPSPEREFVCGAVLIVGGFFLGASYLYKLIFSIAMLPWFWRRKPAEPRDSWRHATWWLLATALWLEGIMGFLINVVIAPRSMATALWALDATYVVSQLLTWALMVCLLREMVIYCVRRARFLLYSGRRESVSA